MTSTRLSGVDYYPLTARYEFLGCLHSAAHTTRLGYQRENGALFDVGLLR